MIKLIFINPFSVTWALTLSLQSAKEVALNDQVQNGRLSEAIRVSGGCGCCSLMSGVENNGHAVKFFSFIADVFVSSVIITAHTLPPEKDLSMSESSWGLVHFSLSVFILQCL